VVWLKGKGEGEEKESGGVCVLNLLFLLVKVLGLDSFLIQGFLPYFSFGPFL